MKTIRAIAAIADQIRWTASQMKPQFWPKKQTPVALQFLESNLLQLEMICHEPLMAIRENIQEKWSEVLEEEFQDENWMLPRKVRGVESPIASPTAPHSRADPSPSAEDKEQKNKDAEESFFKSEAYSLDRQEAIMENQGEHVDYLKATGDEQAFTWRDAIRSTLRIYDAAYMEVSRHHRFIEKIEKIKKSEESEESAPADWALDTMKDMSKRRAIPTRSNQELLIELALPVIFKSPPNTQTEKRMAAWKSEADVKKALDIHLGRFGDTRLWINEFTQKLDAPSAAEPAMFFICQHAYAPKAGLKPTTKWIVGGTTPLIGSNKTMKWPWAHDVYKSIREQGLGKDWVAKVKAANDAQFDRETELLNDHPGAEIVSVRQQVLLELTKDDNHKAHVAQVSCRGLAISKTLEPTFCCYRCQCNYQYSVLSDHMSANNEAALEHLGEYNWGRRCSWYHQCAEGLTAVQCRQFDQQQMASSTQQKGKAKGLPHKLLKKKKSTMAF
ncbi:uncharacterized protein J4E92_007844 [Alternaria infectoria]|uniref:uncharacterized protein n=1 Tax=Alternaria infectoria TaxID=45303 RepID=UPI00221E6163|nr:uncharacterized protein J4E92_007844 [Alternaria infectoria]KAI4923091.1 hypothetical protein J4E92_007844 [Alternaria infectoria]